MCLVGWVVREDEEKQGERRGFITRIFVRSFAGAYTTIFYVYLVYCVYIGGDRSLINICIYVKHLVVARGNGGLDAVYRLLSYPVADHLI